MDSPTKSHKFECLDGVEYVRHYILDVDTAEVLSLLLDRLGYSIRITDVRSIDGETRRYELIKKD